MALYPLTEHGRAPQDAVRYAADAIRGTVAEADLQAELLSCLGVFGRLAYPSLKLFELIGREPMKESKLIRELFAEELEQADRAGLLRGQRTSIMEILKNRFGEAAVSPLSSLLAGITDQARLSTLNWLAVTCASPGEFRQAATQP
jgi:hypothetical protein